MMRASVCIYAHLLKPLYLVVLEIVGQSHANAAENVGVGSFGSFIAQSGDRSIIPITRFLSLPEFLMIDTL